MAMMPKFARASKKVMDGKKHMPAKKPAQPPMKKSGKGC